MTETKRTKLQNCDVVICVFDVSCLLSENIMFFADRKSESQLPPVASASEARVRMNSEAGGERSGAPGL